MTLVSQILGLFAYAFVVALGIGALAVLVIYVIDKTQTKLAIRRNFPVIDRFRYVFEQIGEFFRQYFFAMDREEMPFNRAERVPHWHHDSRQETAAGAGGYRQG